MPTRRKVKGSRSGYGFVVVCLLIVVLVFAAVQCLRENEKSGDVPVEESTIASAFLEFDVNSRCIDAIIEVQQEIVALKEEALSNDDGSEAAATAVDTSDLSRSGSIVGSYTKEWPTEGAKYNPCYSVHIISVSGNDVRLTVSKVGRNLSPLIGTDSENMGGILGIMDENGIIYFSYTEDGWYGEGYGTIDIRGDHLVIDVTATYVDSLARGSLDTNGPLTLYKVSSDSSGALHVGD